MNLSSSKITRPCRIAYISDMHDFTYGKRLYKRLLKLKPDIVIIGGDLINKTDSSVCKSIEAFLKDISYFTKIYFSNGNHEEFIREYNLSFYKELEKDLDEYGITHISNDTLSVDEFSLMSLELPLSYYAKGKVKDYDESEVKSLLKADFDDSKYKILLCHNPRYTDDVLSFNPDLILSGHTHGGMVRIPFLGAILNPEFELFPKYSGGVYSLKDGIMGIVSKGLFTHGFYIRIFDMAELIIINLMPERDSLK